MNGAALVANDYVYVFSASAVETMRDVKRLLGFGSERGAETAISVGPIGGAMMNDIDRIARECGSPDWDGYGGAPIAEAAIRAAESLARELSLLGGGIAAPEVSPAPDGGILFDWVRGSDRLAISVSGDGFLTYAAIGPLRRGKGRERFSRPLPVQIRVHLARFT
jgi:hypothetical protein